MKYTMNFNKIKNKYKLLILLAIEIVIAFVYINTKNDTAEIITLLIYLLVFFLIFKLIWQMIGRNIFGSIKDFLKKLFKFIISKTKFIIRQVRSVLKAIGLGGFLDGLDKTSFEFDFNLKSKIKRLFRTKIKLDLLKADKNSEKIKFMYIKLILKSINNGYYYKNSQTPDEFYTILKNKDLDYLINCYKLVRYDKNIKISDEEIEQCERELNIALKR